MSEPFLIEPEAADELDYAARWYESRRRGLGGEFLLAIDETLQFIDSWPASAPLVPQLPGDLPVRRAPVRRFPYHVVYLETDVAIRILAFAQTVGSRGTGDLESDLTPATSPFARQAQHKGLDQRRVPPIPGAARSAWILPQLRRQCGAFRPAPPNGSESSERIRGCLCSSPLLKLSRSAGWDSAYTSWRRRGTRRPRAG